MSTTCLEKARGSALIVAIFILVVLAALGAAIVSLSSSAQIGAALDMQGARALQAARFGSEWGVYQLLRGACSGGDFCARCQGASYATPVTQDLGSLAGSMSTFTVTVSCGSGAASYTEGTSTLWVYQITANACNQASGGACPNTSTAAVGSVGYVERRVSLTLTN